MTSYHASICGACQKDIIKQDEVKTIHCPSCKTMWQNKGLRTTVNPKKPIEGYPCMACGNGMLCQKYWNTIYCDACNMKWFASKNKYFYSKAQLRTDLSKIG